MSNDQDPDATIRALEEQLEAAKAKAKIEAMEAELAALKAKDADAVAILEDSMGEEFKHFSMELEFLLRKTPKWRKTAEGILFTKGDIVKHGEAAEEAAG